MRPLLAVSLFALACTLAIPAMAQNKEVGVPILKAPYHLPVFTNEYVPGVTRSLRNIGTTRIEIEEFEIK